MSKLTPKQQQRFQKNLLISGFSETDQLSLLASSVFVVGAGGLGSPLLFYLAAAGIGKIGICDYDQVDLSNLNRQILHRESDLGQLKTRSARDKLKALHSGLQIELFETKLSGNNAGEFFADYDLVIDCVDSFPIRMVINDGCLETGKPFIHAGVEGYQGQLFTHLPGGSCLRCIFPGEGELPEKQEPLGILGAVAGIAGSMQAVEAVKILTGKQSSYAGQLVFFDFFSGTSKRIKVPKSCSSCSARIKND
ncbi:MAG: HesA/MoeB/ThiF family protein [Deltaproteobacteria bacterium]|jgi:molybdopterin/thiamine biosynthesis adenylyltransferase|nr:HesA/MoeB/ThiF family protein [Deltaproteobacteria bacterium]